MADSTVPSRLTEGQAPDKNYRLMANNSHKDRSKFNVSGGHPQFGPNNPQRKAKGKLRHRH